VKVIKSSFGCEHSNDITCCNCRYGNVEGREPKQTVIEDSVEYSRTHLDERLNVGFNLINEQIGG